MTTKRRNTGIMKIYKSYVFRTKDPVIDELRTLAQDTHGDLTGKTLSKVSDDGGPAAGTMYNWFYGKTRRPQSASVEAAGRAMGFQRKWVRMKRG